MKLNKMWAGLSGLLGALALFSQPALAFNPSNDNFENGAIITGPHGSIGLHSYGATAQPNEPLTITYNCSKTIWITWSATFSGPVHFSTVGSSVKDTVMGVYTGSSIDNLTTIATNDDNNLEKAAEVTFDAVSGTTYYIDVAGVGETSGSIYFAWDQQVSPNDNFADAQSIAGVSGHIIGNTADATNQSPEPLRNVYNCGKSIWYKWTPLSSGPVSFDLSSSRYWPEGLYDSVMGVYTGSALNSLTTVTTDNDSGEDSTAKVSFNAVRDTTYYIAVAGIADASGAISLQWDQQSCPNDNFADAQLLIGESTSNQTTGIEGNSTYATVEAGEPIVSAFPCKKTIWYKWAPARNGTAHFAVTSSGRFEPKCMAVYTGSTLNSLTEISKSTGETSDPTASFIAAAGTTYYIAIASVGPNSTGDPLFLNWNRNVRMSGRVTNSLGVGINGAKVVAVSTSNPTGPAIQMLTDVKGYYQSDNLFPDAFNVSPVLPGYTLAPPSRFVDLMADINNVNFVASNGAKTAVSVSNATILEGNSGTVNAVFTVSLSGISTLPVKVNYATSNDTAVAPNDFNAAANTLTFAPGETSKTVSIAVKGDLTDEIDERFNLILSNPINANINDNLGVCTISDDDAPPVVSINSPSISEGSSINSKVVRFTIKLSVPSSKTVFVYGKTVPSSSTETTEPATAKVDYNSVTLVYLEFKPGELTRNFDLSIKGDTIDEANETFNFVLSSPSNATLGAAIGTCTIIDDDVTPTFSVSDASLTEGNSGTVNATFTINLSAASGRVVKVNVGTLDNTALAGADYIGQPSATLTFLPGQTSKVVTVAVKGDLIDELNETFQLKLTNPVNATIADSTGIGTIIDDDNAPSISVTASSVTEEDGGQIDLPFTLKLSAPSSKVITIKVQTSPTNSDPATAGTDYVAIPLTTVTFTPGETTKIINVPVYGDLLDEVNEKVGLSLSVPGNATLKTGKVEGIILDDDAPPAFYFWGAIVEEGDNDIRQGYFLATLTQPSGKTVTVSFKTGPSPTTPATEGIDYVAIPPTTITFAPGQTSQKIYFSVIGDTLYEGRERFRGLFSNAVNASLPDTFADAQIVEYDERPSVSFDAVSVVEGNSGTKTVTLTVNLSKPAGVTIQSSYATADDIATAGSDYVARQGTLTFAPGQTKTTTSFVINGDTDNEENESFKVLFPDFPGSPTATITILNDDTPIRPGDRSGGVS